MKEIKPDYECVQVEDQNQRPAIKFQEPKRRRKNNKKNTRGRNTQYVVSFDFSVCPPIKKVKCIKHFRR